MSMTNDSPERALGMLLRKLKLPTFQAQHAEISSRAEREGWSFGQALLHLCEMEIEERGQRRIARLLKASELPAEKTIATLDRRKLSPKVRSQLASLCEGGFLNRAENVLVFGLPGRVRISPNVIVGIARS